jgi:hypothetical protein
VWGCTRRRHSRSSTLGWCPWNIYQLHVLDVMQNGLWYTNGGAAGVPPVLSAITSDQGKSQGLYKKSAYRKTEMHEHRLDHSYPQPC